MTDEIDDMLEQRFGNIGKRPMLGTGPPPAHRGAEASLQSVHSAPPGLLNQTPPPRFEQWSDAALFALSRDTRAWIIEGPEGPVGDWTDSRAHVLTLYTIARNINSPDPRILGKPPLCLEIGIRHGVTTLALLHAMRETGGTLFSVEIDEAWAKAALSEVERAGLESQWQMRVTGSDDFADMWRKANGPQFDFIWIDGDHGLEQVTKDADNFAPMVRRGGILAFHDYYSQPYPCDPPVCPPFPSYASVPVEKLRASGEWEVFVMPFSYGVALCRKL